MICIEWVLIRWAKLWIKMELRICYQLVRRKLRKVLDMLRILWRNIWGRIRMRIRVLIIMWIIRWGLLISKKMWMNMLILILMMLVMVVIFSITNLKLSKIYSNLHQLLNKNHSISKRTKNHQFNVRKYSIGNNNNKFWLKKRWYDKKLHNHHNPNHSMNKSRIKFRVSLLQNSNNLLNPKTNK